MKQRKVERNTEKNLRAGWIAAVSCLALGLGLAGTGGALSAAQTAYRLANPEDSVVGQAFYTKPGKKDSLKNVARRDGLGADEMKSSNPEVKNVWLPGADTDILVPTLFVLPNAPRRGLVINLAEKRLYYFPASGEVFTYAVTIGQEGWDTPLGNFSIVEKTKDPSWRPPASIRAEQAAEGNPLPAVVPPGPDNPLGRYAMRLSARHYLIHGTNNPWGLGSRLSHGCIRMYPEDIKQLFPHIPIDTSVKIVNQPYKVGWRGNDLYLEVHIPDGKRATSPNKVIPASIANAQGIHVDWEEVRRALEENTGLPRLVGGRQEPAGRLYLDRVF